jgi:Ser/Thr protein kinase RdoA (MazF antagonist)
MACEDALVESRRAQLARLRRVGLAALDDYPVTAERLDFIAHGENTTFRVTTAGGRYLLRVHRPLRHGRDTDQPAAVRSELEWLIALGTGSGVRVPEPVPAHNGDLAIVAEAGGAVRTCSLLRWVDGRIRERNPRPTHLRRIGEMMGRLHNHADGWTRPAGFTRIRWDWETFFGDVLVYGDRPAREVWRLLPPRVRRRFERVAERAARVLPGLGRDPGVFGLIHADLHTRNAVFRGDRAALIDFDDCGFGYRAYDVAVALCELRHGFGYEAYRDALLTGYRAGRPLADDLVAHLDDLIAVREVVFGLWYTGAAQVNPAFAADLDATLAGSVDRIDNLARS